MKRSVLAFVGMDPALIESVRQRGGGCAAFSLAGKVLPGMVVSVYDGDTMTVALPVFGEVYRFTVRVAGIDTPEIKSKSADLRAKAVRARNRVLQLIGLKGVGLEDPLTKKEIEGRLEKERPLVEVACKEWDKYGRLMAEVRPLEYDRTTGVVRGPSVAEVLIAEKLAYAYGGETKLTEAEQSDVIV